MKNKMNVLLSDLVLFYHKLQSYHWFVKGHPFFQVHGKLEGYYDEIKEQIDEVAETMLMTGIKPVSKVSEFASLSKITEASGDYVETKEIFDNILSDFSYLLKSVSEIKSQADEESNYLVSAKMDGLIESYSKTIWMINQSRL